MQLVTWDSCLASDTHGKILHVRSSRWWQRYCYGASDIFVSSSDWSYTRMLYSVKQHLLTLANVVSRSLCMRSFSRLQEGLHFFMLAIWIWGSTHQLVTYIAPLFESRLVWQLTSAIKSCVLHSEHSSNKPRLPCQRTRIHGTLNRHCSYDHFTPAIQLMTNTLMNPV